MNRQRKAAVWLIAAFSLCLLLPLFALTALADEPEGAQERLGDDLVGIYAEVDFEEDVGGDLLFAAGLAEVEGKVEGNIRAAGFRLLFEGEVGRNVTAAGMEVFTDSGFSAKSCCFAGATLILSGHFEELVVACDEVYLLGEVTGRLDVTADKVYISDEAVFTEAVITASERPTLIHGTVFADGSDLQTRVSVEEKGVLNDSTPNGGKIVFTESESAFVSSAKSLLFTVPTAALLALFTAFLLRNETRSAEEFRSHPVRFSLAGLLLMLCLPGAAVFLLFPVFTAPVSIVLLLLFALVSVTANGLAAVLVAKRFFPNKNVYLLSALFGAGFALLGIVPLLGQLVSFLCSLAAFGTLWVLLRRKKAYPGAAEIPLREYPPEDFRV